MRVARRIEYVPIDEVVPAARNAKNHDGAAISTSIGRFGFVTPLVRDDRTGRLVEGHGRLEQLRVAADAGETPGGCRRVNGALLVPVVVGWASADDAEAEAYGIAANRTTELGGWDERALTEILGDLARVDMLAATGFDHADLDGLLDSLQEPPFTLDDDTPAGGRGDEYYTPEWVFQRMGLEFDLDVAAPPGGISWIPAKRYFTKADDGLAQPWEGRVWMNPPFSLPRPWMDRFVEHRHGVTVFLISIGRWLAALWEQADGFVIMPPPFEFVGGKGTGIPWPIGFAAFGDECVEAIGRLGVVRVPG